MPEKKPFITLEQAQEIIADVPLSLIHISEPTRPY